MPHLVVGGHIWRIVFEFFIYVAYIYIGNYTGFHVGTRGFCYNNTSFKSKVLIKSYIIDIRICNKKFI